MIVYDIPKGKVQNIHLKPMPLTDNKRKSIEDAIKAEMQKLK